MFVFHCMITLSVSIDCFSVVLSLSFHPQKFKNFIMNQIRHSLYFHILHFLFVLIYSRPLHSQYTKSCTAPDQVIDLVILVLYFTGNIYLFIYQRGSLAQTGLDIPQYIHTHICLLWKVIASYSQTCLCFTYTISKGFV